jgi:ubiquinone/menaquinone biosynthesis C-methylase UbiE
MTEQLRLPRPARLLDAGCGLGTEAMELARTGGVDVVGIDACQAQTLLGLIADPVPVVTELVRVTRPGGRVVILDLDQGSTLLDHPDRATTRIVLQALVDGFANGWAGRQLRRLLLQVGADDVTVDVTTMDLHPAFLFQLLIPTLRRLRSDGTVDQATLDHWWNELAELAEAGLFSATITWFLAAGTVAG